MPIDGRNRARSFRTRVICAGVLAGCVLPGSLACEAEDIVGPIYIWEHGVRAPSAIEGPSSGDLNTDYQYCASGASCNWDHAITKYRFTGDGHSHDWGPECNTFNWSTTGTKSVEVQARCSAGLESSWMRKSVTIGSPQ